MVVQGPFQVELVRADTREPFKEHESEHGEIYVEVEPDCEFFIRLKHTHPKHFMVRADFVLDGKNLGYCTNLVHGREELHGLWTILGDKKINQALKFCVQKTGFDTSKRWVGSLEVTFSEAIGAGIHRIKDAKNKWTGGIVEGCIDNLMQKAIKSGEGELSLVTANPRRKKRYTAGKQLDTMTLYYCTAVGLIQAGLLPRPPFWDTARINHPREIFSPKRISKSLRRCLDVNPRPLVLVPEHKELGQKEVVVDFFDLVDADDDDEEDSEEEEDPKGDSNGVTDQQKGAEPIEEEGQGGEAEETTSQSEGKQCSVQDAVDGDKEDNEASPVPKDNDETEMARDKEALREDEAEIDDEDEALADDKDDLDGSNGVKRKLDFSEKASPPKASSNRKRRYGRKI